MLAIEIDAKQLDRLAEASAAAGKKVAKEMAGAINATAKKARLDIGRQIRETINIKKAAAERPLSIKADATTSSLIAVVHLKKEDRYGLQHFGAKQNKTGVSYKVGKKADAKPYLVRLWVQSRDKWHLDYTVASGSVWEQNAK